MEGKVTLVDKKELRKELRKILLLAIAISVFLLAVGYGFVIVLTHTFKENTEFQMDYEIHDYKSRITTQIERNFQTLETLASFIGSAGLDLTNSFPEYLSESFEHNEFVALSYFTKEGNGTVITGKNGISLNRVLSKSAPQIQEVVNSALSGEKAISNFFEGVLSGQTVFTFGVPVYRGSEIVGVLSASDNAAVFSNLLDDETIMNGNAHIHLLDDSGKFLIRTSAVVTENPESIMEEPYLDQDEIKRVQTTMDLGKQVQFTFSYKGNQYFTLLEPLDYNGWYLFCVNSVMASNEYIYTLVYAIIGFFIVIVVIFIIMLRYAYRQIMTNNEKLLKVAYTDSLTGIDNYARFQKVVGTAMKETEDYSLAILNVRHFKFINEMFGKEKADELLCYIAKNLKNSMQENEYVCRYSGDQFYIFLRETKEEVISERLRFMIYSVIDIGNRVQSSYRVDLNFGVIINDGSYQDLQQMLTYASFALARSKESYQKQIAFFDIRLHEQVAVDNMIEHSMKAALDNHEFKLFLQPKVDLKTNKVAGAEALVRWIQEDGNMMFPDQFIPIFEKNGFCVQLDLYMFREACHQLREWIDEGKTPIPISVNQSKLMFYERGYVDKLCAIVAQYDISPSLITLEILENMAIDNFDAFNEKLSVLKEAGFKISLDDFGTGYSSLNTLGKLKIDELKIDRAFLLEVIKGESKNARLIMEEIVEISRKIKVSTVVEGVETKENEQLIKELGCDYGQGYYYSRPINVDQFTEQFLETKKGEWKDE